MKSKTKTRGANGNGNRIADLVKDEAKIKDDTDVAVVETDDDNGEAVADEEADADAANADAPVDDSIKARKKKALEKAEKAIDKVRQKLHEKAQKLAAKFKHGSKSPYPNGNGRTMMMKKEDKAGRAINYETDAFIRSSHSIGVGALKVIANDWVLGDDAKRTREATNMGHNFLSGGGTVYSSRALDINVAEANAKKCLETIHGKADPAEVARLVASWVEDIVYDMYLSNTRGNRNTARTDILPCTVLADMNYGQSPSLASAFENPITPDGELSESDVATREMVEEWVASNKALGKRYYECVEARGGDSAQRVAIYCKSKRRKELVHDAGLEERVVADVSTLIDTILKWIDETRGMGGDNPLPRTISLNMLKVYPVSNPNRDNKGRPKHAAFGGVMRMMITSQAGNAAMKAANYERNGNDSGKPRAMRTTGIVDEILMRLGADGHTDEAKEYVAGFVNFSWGPVKAFLEPVDGHGDWQTKNGYFTGSDELDRAADYIRTNWDVMTPVAVEVAAGVKAVMDDYASELADLEAAASKN